MVGTLMSEALMLHGRNGRDGPEGRDGRDGPDAYCQKLVRTIGMAGGNGRDSRDVGDVVIRTEVSWPTMVNRNTVFFFCNLIRTMQRLARLGC